MALEIVYAIHDFEAENEDEIAFLMGDPIVVIEKDEKYMDGWWQGRNIHGHVGLFPMNYTTIEQPTTNRTSQSSTYTSSPEPERYMGSFSLEDEIDHAISQVQIVPDQSNSSERFSSRASRRSRQEFSKLKPEDWTVDQVAAWLSSVGLQSVTDNFVDQEITGDILIDLDVDALKELGISTFGKRHKVMHAITGLKKDQQDIKIEAPSNNQPSTTPEAIHSIGTMPLPTTTDTQVTRLITNNDIRSSPPSPIDTDGLYQYPRKAPLPPMPAHEDPDRNLYHLSPLPRQHDSMRPISPQSLESSNVSRSNTFNTISSKKSSSSNATSRSTERSLGHNIGLPHRMPSQKSTSSSELDTKHSSTFSGRPDWASEIPTSAVTVTPSPSTKSVPPNHTLRPANPHTLSVSSVEPTDDGRASADAAQAPEHEGWLHKQGDKYKTWNKRWFVLKGIHLFYFKSPKDVRMKGIVNLRNYRIIVDASIHSGKYCFKAQHDKERTFYFYTDTEESMRLWVKMLIKATIARDFQAPVMSSNHIATVPLEVARKMRPRPPSVIMYKNQNQNPNQNQNQGKQTEEVKMEMLQEEEECFAGGGMTTLANTTSSMRLSFDPEDRSNKSSDLSQYLKQSRSTQRLSQDMHQRHQQSLKPRKLSFQSSRRSNASIDYPHPSGDLTREYIDWVNQHLMEPYHISDLSSGFQDGHVLIALLEAISQQVVQKPSFKKEESTSAIALELLVAAFRFMNSQDVHSDGRYTLKEIYNGNEQKVIEMIDSLRDWEEGINEERQIDAIHRKDGFGWPTFSVSTQRASRPGMI
ncbi:hypothetical protein CLU79DRAFT_778253 [Phycomyces nitens]|nr:hypothetical protein CLU79DRAFT_778253 [Phycomyces nitens]